jgi:putative endonuclease
LKLYWVYILASRPGGALYVGVTNNLSLRVYEHKQGRGSEHTRRYKIDKLVYYESYPDIRDAIQREKNIKHWPRSWKTRLIYGMNPTWRDLYEELTGEVVVTGLVPMTSMREAPSLQERDGRDNPRVTPEDGHDTLNHHLYLSSPGLSR